MQQYFVTKENGKFILKPEDLYHLTVVMRAKDGSEICCLYLKKAYLCTFKGNQKEYEITEICELKQDSELPIPVTLYQALIRNENFDLVIQKATELGVYSIIPTIFDRNVVKIDGKEDTKIKRYNLIAKGASEQSRRNVIPEVLLPIKIKNITLSDGEIGLLAYEKNDDTQSFSSLEKVLKEAKKISILIGPEGGITEEEYQTLIAKGFRSITLGRRILRSETASICALSIVSYILESK